MCQTLFQGPRNTPRKKGQNFCLHKTYILIRKKVYKLKYDQGEEVLRAIKKMQAKNKSVMGKEKLEALITDKTGKVTDGSSS